MRGSQHAAAGALAHGTPGAHMTTDANVSGAVMREPGTGRGTWAMGSHFEHLLEDTEPAGRLGVALVTQPPGVATPLHQHSNEAEACFVLEGRVGYRAGDEQFEMYDGCFAYLPRKVPHAFGSGASTGTTPRAQCSWRSDAPVRRGRYPRDRDAASRLGRSGS